MTCRPALSPLSALSSLGLGLSLALSLWYADALAADERCGTKTPSAEAISLLPPSDCSLGRTIPDEQYEPGVTWEVTVVVHIIHSITGLGNLPDSLVHSQIDVLNEDFLAMPGTPGAPGKDVRIRFRLATEDPDGNPTTGITRTESDLYFSDAVNYWDELAWDPTRYCNVYTNSAGGGGVILGYVPFFPQEGGVGTNEDRIVIVYSAFGRPGTGGPPYDQGRTLTHEMGHYMGLYHTFQDGCGVTTPPGCYTSGDRVCDTAAEAASQGGCPEGEVSCVDPDPIHDYMDYTDDLCMYEFTPEQARRIRCTLTHYRPTIYEAIPTSVGPAPSGMSAGAGLALGANQPNPFALKTEMAFRTARGGNVSLVVLDVTGRVVKTLVSGALPAGEHRAVWDGADEKRAEMASGVYFYRLETDEGNLVRRMVLVR